VQKLEQCSSCRKSFLVSFWDRLHGFLVPCPTCGILNGRSWHVRSVAFAGLLLNVLSFFFVMRPAAAALTAVGFAGLLYITAQPALSYQHPSLEVAWYVTLLLGPMILDAILLVRHETKLGQPSRAGRTNGLPAAEAQSPIEPR
jgi:hypothetical protein